MPAVAPLHWLLGLCVHFQASARQFAAVPRPDNVQDLWHPDRSKGIENIEIDLDLPPRQRFKFLAREHRERYISFTEKRMAAIKKFDPAYLDELLSHLDIEDEYIQEMEGFLEEIGDPRCTLRLSLIGQFKYELGFSQPFACTGIVAAMENGTVVHGRNMDITQKHSLAPPGTGMFNAVFKRNGKPLYEAIWGIGMFGVHTAMRYGGWTIEHNTRSTGAWTQEVWNKAVLDASTKGGRMNAFVARSIMERVPDFETAVQEFAKAQYLAPMYWILAGVKPFDAAVVTVNQAGSHAAHNIRLLKHEPNHWFMVQTNDDHWLLPKDPRRDTGITLMKVKGRKRVEHGSVWEAMRKFPVCNPNTQWTWQAIPALNTTRFTQKACTL